MADIVRLDVPLFIRLLELSREEIRDDADIHDIAEIVIKMSEQGPVTMNNYKDIIEFTKRQGESTNESGLQYHTGVKKHGAEYMKKAAEAGRKGASQEELGKLRDKYSKAYKKEDHGPEDPEADYNQGEYDREGDMAKDQLRTVNDAAKELYSIIAADENLPEWVQAKITKAMDYLDTARDYMKANKYAETAEVDELDRIKQLGGIK